MQPSGFAEDLDKSTFSDPRDYVSQTSLKKAEYLANECKNDVRFYSSRCSSYNNYDFVG